MTGTNCDLFTHKSSWSYLNHLVCIYIYIYITGSEEEHENITDTEQH
jgi:hypothetical protein